MCHPFRDRSVQAFVRNLKLSPIEVGNETFLDAKYFHVLQPIRDAVMEHLRPFMRKKLVDIRERCTLQFESNNLKLKDPDAFPMPSLPCQHDTLIVFLLTIDTITKKNGKKEHSKHDTSALLLNGTVIFLFACFILRSQQHSLQNTQHSDILLRFR